MIFVDDSTAGFSPRVLSSTLRTHAPRICVPRNSRTLLSAPSDGERMRMRTLKRWTRDAKVERSVYTAKPVRWWVNKKREGANAAARPRCPLRGEENHWFIANSKTFARQKWNFIVRLRSGRDTRVTEHTWELWYNGNLAPWLRSCQDKCLSCLDHFQLLRTYDPICPDSWIYSCNQ